ncbi:MAG: hypothetical protein ACRDDF_02870, partial [Aeromonas sp.]
MKKKQTKKTKTKKTFRFEKKNKKQKTTTVSVRFFVFSSHMVRSEFLSPYNRPRQYTGQDVFNAVKNPMVHHISIWPESRISLTSPFPADPIVHSVDLLSGNRTRHLVVMSWFRIANTRTNGVPHGLTLIQLHSLYFLSMMHSP